MFASPKFRAVTPLGHNKAILFTIVAIVVLLTQGLEPASGAAARKPKNDNHAASLNCTDHLKIIDRCSLQSTYSHATSSSPYPNNTVEMRASCERIVEGIKCLRVYGKCLKSFGRRSLTSYTNGRSKHSKKLCANLQDPKTIDFMKANECISKSNKRPLMIASERELIQAIQVLAKDQNITWENRLHSACCAASAFKNKALSDMEPECSRFKESQEEMLNSMVGELLDTVCPEQNRLNEICPKLPRLVIPKQFNGGSLTAAALDLVVMLADKAD